MASKTERQVAMHTAMARFPYVKTLETFDFSSQHSVDKRKIHDLAEGHPTRNLFGAILRQLTALSVPAG